ncbi:MAG: hypothetical protein HY912_11795, partial [Desulfomonile tiedjei]|nr:hypothetical protein [Desulfomonile tiedjei]
MKERSYSIVLEPNIKEGLDRSKVVRKLAALFKRDESLIEKLIASSPRTIRKDLDLATAEKYVRLIQAAGASAKIESEEVQVPHAEPDLAAKLSTQESTPDESRSPERSVRQAGDEEERIEPAAATRPPEQIEEPAAK